MQHKLPPRIIFVKQQQQQQQSQQQQQQQSTCSKLTNLYLLTTVDVVAIAPPLLGLQHHVEVVLYVYPWPANFFEIGNPDIKKNPRDITRSKKLKLTLAPLFPPKIIFQWSRSRTCSTTSQWSLVTKGSTGKCFLSILLQCEARRTCCQDAIH